MKTLAFAGSKGVAAVGMLAIAAVLSRVFDKVDYATYRQTLLVYQFAGPLLGLGLPAALFYFLPGETIRLRAVLLENLILLGTLGGIFSLFLILGGNRLIASQFSNPELEETLLIFALYPILFLPTTAVSAVLVVQGKVRWLLLHTLATRLARVGLVVGAVWLFAAGPAGAVGATTISGIIVLSSGLFLMLRAVPGEKGSRPTLAGMSSQLKYAVPIGLALMLEKLAMGVDQVLVSMLCSREDFAVFSNGAMEIPFIQMITVPATAIVLPELVALYKSNNKKEALVLWRKAARKVAVVLLPIGGVLFVIAPELMTVLYSEDYENSAGPLRVYLLLLPARLVFFAAIFQAASRTDLILKRAVGTLVLNIVVSYPLVSHMGFQGAAWGTVIVFWGYVFPYCLCHCSRLLETRWFKLMPYQQVGIILLLIAAAGAFASLARAYLALSNAFLVGAATATIMLILLLPPLALLFRKDLSSYWQAIQKRVSGKEQGPPAGS